MAAATSSPLLLALCSVSLLVIGGPRMAAAAVPSPYPALHGGSRSGAAPPNGASPDPLSDYVWDLAGLPDPFAYQSFVDLPVQATSAPTSAFSGVESMLTKESAVHVRAPGLITVKFAQEAACWVEFESAGLAASGAKLDMTISENRLPGEVHNLRPKAYGGNGSSGGAASYRLEPNKQLYEGVRYIFINVTDAGSGAGWRCLLPRSLGVPTATLTNRV
eukprot:SAG25_NODE_81_length_16694_cov_8.663332_8_plen_219_part_00